MDTHIGISSEGRMKHYSGFILYSLQLLYLFARLSIIMDSLRSVPLILLFVALISICLHECIPPKNNPFVIKYVL